MKRIITCHCGARIPRRQIPDHYRLTPRHRELRTHHRIGVIASERKRFLDTAEAATRQGQTVLRFTATPRMEACLRRLLQRCECLGYLEYVCPQCEQVLSRRFSKERYTGISPEIAVRLCQCGCGQAVTSKKGRFLPGHDQQLRATIERSVGGLGALNTLAEQHIGRPIKGNDSVPSWPVLRTPPRRLRRGRPGFRPWVASLTRQELLV